MPRRPLYHKMPAVPSRGEISALEALEAIEKMRLYTEDAVRELTKKFYDFKQEVGDLLPKDGSEALEGNLDVAAHYIEGAEIADPSAPATNRGRIYFRDNGLGKTQLVVRFPTGVVQVIATEP